MVGGDVLPPSVTGTADLLTANSGPAGLCPDGARPDRVYVTDRYEMAEVCAALHPDKGCVYRVLPEWPLEEGTDNPGLF
ncbi:hypothetical protein [Melittangium boletus]|uniref:hypothetical protein n=1 Tax=Melittangium boletus TaxID=83453 RepID=UPI003DA2253E